MSNRVKHVTRHKSRKKVPSLFGYLNVDSRNLRFPSRLRSILVLPYQFPQLFSISSLSSWISSHIRLLDYIIVSRKRLEGSSVSNHLNRITAFRQEYNFQSPFASIHSPLPTSRRSFSLPFPSNMWRKDHLRLYSQSSLKSAMEMRPPPSKEIVEITISPPPLSFKPGLPFFLIFISLLASCVLSALDLTSIATALPTIAADLKTTEYTWVGSAYALTSTALIPWTGAMAAIFGRRATLLSALICFTIGSALSGAAPSMTVLIAGRAIQGAGGGGILVMTDIILVDLVPLANRGGYYGLVGAVWAASSSIGPPVGGALSSAGKWRWIFYLNLPIAGVAIILVACFLNVKVPATTFREKIRQIDWANIIFVASTSSAVIGITFGGLAYPWTSWHVLVPLIVGFVGMGAFILVEKWWIINPTVPFEMLTSPTALIAFWTNFLHGIVVLSAIYFLPVYFQSTKGASAITSGIDVFSLSFSIAPFAIFTGISVAIFKHYKTQNVVGWCLVIIGFGLMSLLKVDSLKVEWVCYPFVVGSGMGILYTATKFGVLAPLRPQQQPHAVAFYNFTRSLGQVFGIALSSAILQNRLLHNLPSEYLAGGTVQTALAHITSIKDLPEPMRTEVRVAFASSLRVVWQTGAGLGGLGLLSAAVFMKQITLTTETDELWGIDDKRKESVHFVVGQAV